MNKYSFLLLIIGISSINCTTNKTLFLNNYESNNDLEFHKIKNKVKSVKTTHYSIYKDTIALNRTEIIEFNKKGFYVSIKELDSDEKIKTNKLFHYDKYGNFVDKTYTYTYNQKGCIIKKENFIKDKSTHRMEFIIDEKCRINESKHFFKDTLDSRYIIKYDKKGNSIYEKKIDVNNGEFQECKRNYKRNLLIKEEWTLSRIQNHLSKYKNLYFYNNENKLIIEKLNFENDSIYYERHYTYNNKGIIKKIYSINKEQVRTTKSYEFFNLYGDLTKSYSELIKILSIKNSFMNKNGKIVGHKWIYKYNNDGNLNNNKEILNYIQNNDTLKFKYKYDNHNNWIEKKSFRDEVPISIIKREIIYY